MRLWKRTREQMGDEAREIFAAEPPQDDAMGVVLNAWSDLTIGMLDGGFLWLAVDRWCERHQLGDEEARVLWLVIKRLYIEEMDRRAFEANRPKPPTA